MADKLLSGKRCKPKAGAVGASLGHPQGGEDVQELHLEPAEVCADPHDKSDMEDAGNARLISGFYYPSSLSPQRRQKFIVEDVLYPHPGHILPLYPLAKACSKNGRPVSPNSTFLGRLMETSLSTPIFFMSAMPLK